MRITVLGAGYVGLVTGTCFSQFGWSVTCVDTDAAKIERLQRGEIPIYEPGLDRMVAENAAAGRLFFSTDGHASVAQADAVFVAVGTPSRRGDGHADLRYVYQAARDIAAALDGYTVVVTKSTVPVGTGREVARIIREARPDADFSIASNPEFLREGSAIEDFMRPDRVVIGIDDERARSVMSRLYRPLFLNETPIVFTTLETSELIKYAANCFLATKITFINQMADLCETVGADVQQVAKALGLDRRIGSKFLHPGPGYGGSCFPKDTRALVYTAREVNAPVSLVEEVVKINDERKRAMADKIIGACGGSVSGKTIAILGVTFKPNTDDMREAPSLDILPRLIAEGAVVRAYDPVGMDEARGVLPGVDWCGDAYDTMDAADAVVILTEWNEFRALDLDRVRRHLRQPLLIDLRNVYKAEEVSGAGLDYISIGRAPARRVAAGLDAAD